MGLFHHHVKHIQQKEKELDIAIILMEEEHPGRRWQRYPPVQQLYILIDNQNFILMANLSLKPGKRYFISAGLVDHISQAPVPGATMVAKSSSVDNPAVAVVDAAGKVAYVGAGKANLTVVNTWTYQDGNTGDNVSVDKTSIVEITALAAAEVVDQTIDLTGEEDIPADTTTQP